MQRYPSFAEFKGMYNVSPEQLDPESEADNFQDIATSFHQSEASIPLLTWREFQRVRSLTIAALTSYGQLPNRSVKELESVYRDCVGDELMDRTLRVELPNISVLTPQFVECLQKAVLASNRLWRIMIVGESAETVVLIYPETVRIKSSSTAADWKQDLTKVTQLEDSLRNAIDLSDRHQMAHVRDHIVLEIQRLKTDPFRIVGVFDNWKGDRSVLVIWLLYATEAEWCDFEIEAPVETCSGGGFSVRSDGVFGDDYVNDDPPYWLKRCLLPSGYRGSLNIKKIRPGPVVEKTWTVELDPKKVIRSPTDAP